MNMLFTKWGWFTAVALVIGSTSITGCSSDESKGGESGGASGNAGTSSDAGETGEGGNDTGKAGATSKAGEGNAGEGDAGKTSVGKGGSGGKSQGGQAGEGDAGSGVGGRTTGRGGSGSGGRTTGVGGEEPGGAGSGGETVVPEGGSAGAGVGGEAGSGGGAPPVEADIDSLVGSLCDWEFRCCDAGELKYELGYIVDAADCLSVFKYQLHESNSIDNGYADGLGNAMGLLGSLGFTVNLDRVDLNADGISACKAEWDAAVCNPPLSDEPAARVYCELGAAGYSPCAYDNLFIPKLVAGEECTYELSETMVGTNDIECVVGTTCVDANTDDNDKDYPVCITRGLDTDPCGGDDSRCDYGYYCDTNGRCAPKGGVGDPCSFEDPGLPLRDEVDASCLPGLTCNPDTLQCTNYCDEGAVCGDDSQCPEGMSCAPLTVGDNIAEFSVCRYLGYSATDRCDSDDDCVETRHCNAAGVCAADVGGDEACPMQKDTQCPDGFYCKVTTDDLGVATTACTTLGNPGDLCTRDALGAAVGCQAGMLCVYNPDTDSLQNECKSAKSALKTECREDWDCASNMCEFANTAATFKTCITGAVADDTCDADLATGDDTRCAPGFECIESVCVDLLDAGGACEDSGAGNSALCGNGMCVEKWDEFMCTDMPISKPRGGTGMYCDGGDAL